MAAMESPRYPGEVCNDCGARFGRRQPWMATWSTGVCGVCGREASTTQPRDFGHLKPGWERAAPAAAQERRDGRVLP